MTQSYLAGFPWMLSNPKEDTDMATTRRTRKTAPAKKTTRRTSAKDATNAAVAKRQAAKAKASELQSKAKDTATLRKLDVKAKRANAFLEKAATADKQADDRRLSAAMEIAAAKTMCEENKINFKKWAEEHITSQAYETVRKLARIGAAPEPALALADLRNRTAKSQQKTRDKQASAKKTSGSREPAEPQGRKMTGIEVAEKALEALGDKGEASLLDSRARSHGLMVVPEELGKAASQLRRGDMAAVKEAFSFLGGGDQMKFLAWAAEEVGVELSPKSDTTPKKSTSRKAATPKASGDADDLEPPKFLRRAGTRNKRAKKAA